MPVQLTSEKFIRAERRNRLENFRYDLQCKHIDKETTRMHYDIDREKRSIVKSFRTVVKTSGISEEGVPPKDDKDKEHEKSQSYRQGFRISNKRLMEWREREKQLNKFIHQSELDMVKTTRRRIIQRPERAQSAKSKGQLSAEDYDDVFIDDDDDDDASTVSAPPRTSPMDVIKDDLCRDDEEFDIKKWQKSIIEEYKSMIRHPKSRPNSAYTSKEGSKLRSQSTPTLTTKITYTDSTSKKPRPHTAHTQGFRRPTSGKSLPPRPASAKIDPENGDSRKFLITKDSIYIKQGNKFEKFAESADLRPVEKPVLVNNYLRTLTPKSRSIKSTRKTSLNGLCPVEEDAEHDLENGISKKDKCSPKDDEKAGDADENKEKDDTVPEINQTFQKPAVLNAFQKWKSNSSGRPKSGQSTTSSRASHQSSGRLSSTGSTWKPTMADIGAILAASRRTRRDSESSTKRSVTSAPSVSLGIPSDIKEFSRDQEKLANQITPERPLQTNKLVAIDTVVRAAMAFSKAARKRALRQMQDENGADSHEIIRQERIRKLQSRTNVLSSMANMWQADGPEIEAVD